MNTDIEVAKIFRPIDSTTLLELFVILAVASLLIIGLQKALPWVANRLHGKHRLYLLAVVPLLRFLVLLAAFGLSVPLLIEPSVQNMVALLGTLGLALGFALKDYASSLVAGLVAVWEMPYRNGDWIQVGDIYGEVTRVGMRVVRIVTPDDTMVYVPHLKIWNEAISNANNGGPNLQCVTDFYLHPEHDARRVKQTLEDVALTSPYLQIDKPVAVTVQEKPWGTQYRLRAYPIDLRQQFRFKTDLTVRGKASLARLGVAFAATPTTAGESA
jgi:small conductance mechanosensitive channel